MENLTIEQLREAYILATEEGNVIDLETCECNQECDNCPAEQACDQLSETGHYSLFIENYRELGLTEKDRI